MRLSNLLKTRRKLLDIKSSVMAEKLGLARSSYSKMESKTEVCSRLRSALLFFHELADVLDMKAGDVAYNVMPDIPKAGDVDADIQQLAENISRIKIPAQLLIDDLATNKEKMKLFLALNEELENGRTLSVKELQHGIQIAKFMKSLK